MTLCIQAMIPHRGGLPHSDTWGSKPARGSSQFFAACHVLLRLLAPRHPPDALLIRTTLHKPPPRPAEASPSPRTGTIQPIPTSRHGHHQTIPFASPLNTATCPRGHQALAQHQVRHTRIAISQDTPRTPTDPPRAAHATAHTARDRTHRVVLRIQGRTRTRFTITNEHTSAAPYPQLLP